MKILVIGSGGREHAIVHKILEQNADIEIFVAPGNGGISQIAKCVGIGVNDFEALIKFAKDEKIDFTVVGMDEPLVLGIVDEFEKNNLKIFGPDKKAAQIEGSKSFSKELMKKYNIPTAKYKAFDDFERALDYAKNEKYPLVIKADGLALGKGVIICNRFEDCAAALKEIMLDKRFGDSGNTVVIEEFLQGHEVSVLSFCDGKHIVPMVSAKDHKKILDGERGLNTGGMGAISPSRQYTPEIARAAEEQIFDRTVSALNSEGIIFRGIIFFGLMLTEDGPKVIEYNARFGDPETQVVLPRLKTNLLEIFIACVDGRLDEIDIQWEDNAACCVVLASGGYPEKYEIGLKIMGLENFKEDSETIIYHAGTKFLNGEFYTSGGRVLGVTSLADNLDEAIRISYKKIENIHFEKMYCRNDIGKA